MILKFSNLWISTLLCASAAFAQVSPATCPAAGIYDDPNQVDPPWLAIRVVTGRVVTETGNPPREVGPLPGACLALFREKGHKLASSVVADREGRFMFGSVKPGSYRLIVRDPQNACCIANGRVRVYARGQGPVPKCIGLVVRLRPAETGRCSPMTWE